MSDWVSVEDRLPREDGPYFVLFCIDGQDGVFRTDTLFSDGVGFQFAVQTPRGAQVVMWLEGVPEPPTVIVARYSDGES